jgi:hypothetical protein
VLRNLLSLAFYICKAFYLCEALNRVHLQRAPQRGRRLPDGRQLSGEAVCKAPLLRCSRRQPILAATTRMCLGAIRVSTSQWSYFSAAATFHTNFPGTRAHDMAPCMWVAHFDKLQGRSVKEPWLPLTEQNAPAALSSFSRAHPPGACALQPAGGPVMPPPFNLPNTSRGEYSFAYRGACVLQPG